MNLQFPKMHTFLHRSTYIQVMYNFDPCIHQDIHRKSWFPYHCMFPISNLLNEHMMPMLSYRKEIETYQPRADRSSLSPSLANNHRYSHIRNQEISIQVATKCPRELL